MIGVDEAETVRWIRNTGGLGINMNVMAYFVEFSHACSFGRLVLKLQLLIRSLVVDV